MRDDGSPRSARASPAHGAPAPEPRRRRVLRSLGLGLITGAADDDCSAIGTHAAAGAKFGPSFLWTAPAAQAAEALRPLAERPHRVQAEGSSREIVVASGIVQGFSGGPRRGAEVRRAR